MSRLETLTQKNHRSNFPIIGFGTSLVIGGLLTYLGVVKANPYPVTNNSDCYFGTVTQNIIGDSLPNIEAKIRNVTQGQEYNDTTDANGYYNMCTVGIDEENPDKIAILGFKTYPNPFSNNTRFDLKLPGKGEVSLNIYDVSGRLVKTLVNTELNPGSHKYVWDGKDNNDGEVSNGNYFYRLTVKGKTVNGKLTHIESANSNPSLDNLVVNPNESNLIIKPYKNNVVSSLADSLIFSLADTLRFYSWIESNPSVGENNRIMMSLDRDSLTLRDKLEHLKYTYGLLDTDFVFNENRLVRWDDADLQITIDPNAIAAVPYDTLVPILIDQSEFNWENGSSDILTTNDSLPGGVGISFEYPDSLPGMWGATVINEWRTNPLRPKHVTIEISKRLLEQYGSFPDFVLHVFGHEIGHALGFWRHGLYLNEIMSLGGAREPSGQERRILFELYTLIKPGDFMGPYRYRGDSNPGPTSSSVVDHEKLLRECPPDLKFKNLPENH